jgi:hypothetical protein
MHLVCHRNASRSDLAARFSLAAPTELVLFDNILPRSYAIRRSLAARQDSSPPSNSAQVFCNSASHPTNNLASKPVRTNTTPPGSYNRRRTFSHNQYHSNNLARRHDLEREPIVSPGACPKRQSTGEPRHYPRIESFSRVIGHQDWPRY